jgi:hypothetical protein
MLRVTWSYSGNPSASPLDAVRFLSTDTDESHQRVSDEEIAFLLTQNNGDAYLAAADVAEQLAGVASGKAVTRKEVGDLKLEYAYAAAATNYTSLAARLRARASRLAPPVPIAGGINRPPIFFIGMMDSPGTLTVDTFAELPGES